MPYYCVPVCLSVVGQFVWSLMPIINTFRFIFRFRFIEFVAGRLTRNSSGDEIANVNFLYDDVHVRKTIDSCINSATDRRGYVLERMFTKFSKITQCNGQGHSRSPILVPIESSCTTFY